MPTAKLLSIPQSASKDRFHSTVYIVLYLDNFMCKKRIGTKDVDFGKVRSALGNMDSLSTPRNFDTNFIRKP